MNVLTFRNHQQFECGNFYAIKSPQTPRLAPINMVWMYLSIANCQNCLLNIYNNITVSVRNKWFSILLRFTHSFAFEVLCVCVCNFEWKEIKANSFNRWTRLKEVIMIELPLYHFFRHHRIGLWFFYSSNGKKVPKLLNFGESMEINVSLAIVPVMHLRWQKGRKLLCTGIQWVAA